MDHARSYAEFWNYVAPGLPPQNARPTAVKTLTIPVACERCPGLTFPSKRERQAHQEELHQKNAILVFAAGSTKPKHNVTRRVRDGAWRCPHCDLLFYGSPEAIKKHALGVVYSPSKAPQSHPGPWQTIKDEEDEDITYLGERSRSEAVDAEDVEMILLDEPEEDDSQAASEAAAEVQLDANLNMELQYPTSAESRNMNILDHLPADVVPETAPAQVEEVPIPAPVRDFVDSLNIPDYRREPVCRWFVRHGITTDVGLDKLGTSLALDDEALEACWKELEVEGMLAVRFSIDRKLLKRIKAKGLDLLRR